MKFKNKNIILQGKYQFYSELPRFVPPTRILPSTALCNSLISNPDGPVAKSSTLMRESRDQIQCVKFLYFNNHIVGSPGIIFFSQFLLVLYQSKCLGKYINELWELVLANSLSGIHKLKIVCSVCLQICGDIDYLALLVW